MADGKVVIDVILEDGSVTKGVANIDKQLNSVNGSAGKMSGVLRTVTNAAAIAAKALGAVALTAAGIGIQFNASQEQSKVAWTTLLGSASKAEKMLSDINELAKTTQFDTANVDMMAKYMHNAGLEGQALFDELTKVADVSGAFALSADEAKEMARQMSQVRQAGVAYTEDLNILQDRGIPIYKALSEQLGVNVAEVRKMAGEGKITSDIYTAAFDNIAKSVEGSAKSQSQTFSGMLSTIKDNIQILTGTLTEGLFGQLKSGLSEALSILETFNDALKEGGIGAAFKAVLPPEVFERLQSFVDGIKSTFEKIKLVAVPILTEVGSFIMSQINKLVDFWNNNGSQIMQAVSNVFEFIKSVMTSPIVLFLLQTIWGAIKNVIGGALDMIMGVVKIFTGLFTADWSKLWEGIKQLFSGAIDFISGLMTLQFLGGLKTIFMNLLKSGTGLMQSMWTSIVNFFKNFGSNVSSTATEMVMKVIGYFKNLFAGATNVFGQLRTFGASVWNALKEAVIGAARNIWSGVTQHFSNMASNVRNLMHNVKAVIVNIWNQAISFLKGIDLTQIGKNIIQGLISGITGMASAVVDKVKSIGKSISNGFKNALGIHSPSKVMADIAKWIPAGIGVGIEKNEKSAIKSLQGLTDNLVSNIQPEIAVTNRLRGSKPSFGFSMIPFAGFGYAGGIAKSINPKEELLSQTGTVLEIYITSELDGKTVSKEIAGPLRIELDKINERENILKYGRKSK